MISDYYRSHDSDIEISDSEKFQTSESEDIMSPMISDSEVVCDSDVELVWKDYKKYVGSELQQRKFIKLYDTFR